MAKAKQQSTNVNTVNLALLAAASCTVVFIYSVLVVAQNLVQAEMLGSPNSYVAVPAVILSIYGFVKATSSRQRQIAVSIVVAILVSVIFWLYGLTSAGSMLNTQYPDDGNYMPCGCLSREDV